jgi:hypothetical protein
MARRIVGLFAGLLMCASPLAAQQGLTITPQNGQAPEKVQLDQAECNNAATQATGFVPGSAAPPPPETGPSGARVRGAARGAAAGAVVGEVQGDRYDNAPDELRDEHTRNQAQAGAAAGVVAGGARARQGRRQANAQHEAATEQHAAAQAAWQNSYSSCLQGRGYTVAPSS